MKKRSLAGYKVYCPHLHVVRSYLRPYKCSHRGGLNNSYSWLYVAIYVRTSLQFQSEPEPEPEPQPELEPQPEPELQLHM